MSRSTAIAAVTQTLAGLLETALQEEDASYKVLTLPLDKANTEAQQANRLNLFLFQVTHNAAWRNTDLPDLTRPGEPARPPLALNLSYLLTAYGEPGPEIKDQRILGLAMKFMNDHPLLMRDEIQTIFPGSGLENQIERVRISPRSLTLEEIVKTWGAFMTQYRLSVAYDVSVVLIDSAPTGAGALPVLRRGEEDRGVFMEAGLPPFLTRALPPEMLRRGTQVTYQPAIRLGEVLTLEGERLEQLLQSPPGGALLQVRSEAWEPRWAGISALSAGSRPDTLQVTLADPPTELDPPAAPAPPLAWSSGVYTASLLLRRVGRPDLVSNSVPFAIAPAVQVSPNNAATGDLDLTVECFPPLREGQHTFLLLTGRDPLEPAVITPPAGVGQPTQLQFHVTGLTPREYLVRLRVDGVDSMPYRVSTTPGHPPTLEYDPTQKVVIA